MANTLGAYNPIFYANEALIHLRNALGMAARVHRGYDAERDTFGRGDTIRIRKPSTFTTATAPAASSQDLATETVNITLDQWHEVRFEVTDKEWAYTGERLISDHIAPAAYAIANKIDQDLAALYKDVPWLHDYGATTFEAIVDARKVAFDNAVPVSDLGRVHMMVDGTLEAAFLKQNVFHSADTAGADSFGPRMRGTLGTRFGVEVFANQNAPSHTPGTASGGGDNAGAVNNGAGYAVGDTSIAVDTFTGSETVKAGDTLVFAGHTQRYAVTADVTFSTGAGTLVITPGLKAAVADDEVVTIGAQTATAHTQQLFFHRNAFAFAAAPLPMTLPGIDAFTATDPVSGLSVRARRWADGSNSKTLMSLDILYGVKTLDGNLAVRAWT